MLSCRPPLLRSDRRPGGHDRLRPAPRRAGSRRACAHALMSLSTFERRKPNGPRERGFTRRRQRRSAGPRRRRAPWPYGPTARPAGSPPRVRSPGAALARAGNRGGRVGGAVGVPAGQAHSVWRSARHRPAPVLSIAERQPRRPDPGRVRRHPPPGPGSSKASPAGFRKHRFPPAPRRRPVNASGGPRPLIDPWPLRPRSPGDGGMDALLNPDTTRVSGMGHSSHRMPTIRTGNGQTGVEAMPNRVARLSLIRTATAPLLITRVRVAHRSGEHRQTIVLLGTHPDSLSFSSGGPATWRPGSGDASRAFIRSAPLDVGKCAADPPGAVHGRHG